MELYMIDFKGSHFNKEVIMMAVRWYLSYGLSYRDVEELLMERGYIVDHSTIQRWVTKYAAKLQEMFNKKHRKHSRYNSWRVDETYVKVKGKWCYLYRAIDKHGDTLEFMLSETRAESDARDFFERTMSKYGIPEKVTVDKSGSNYAALVYLNLLIFFTTTDLDKCIEIRQIKYLNNMIEQDHRFIKRRVKPMLGFKSHDSAEATIAGYELINMLRKGQHKNAANMNRVEQFYSIAG